MKTIVLAALLAVTACRVGGALGQWAIPTEQDNDSITRMRVDGRTVFAVVATTHAFILGYDGTNWVKLAVLNRPGSGVLRAVTDTDVVLRSTTNGVEFYRLVNPSGALAWALQGVAAMPTNIGAPFVTCATAGSLLCLVPSAHQIWFTGLGHTPKLEAVAADASFTAPCVAGTNGFLVAWESAGRLEARRYSTDSGAILASNHWAAVGPNRFFLGPQALHIWDPATRTLTQVRPETLTAARALALPDCSEIRAVACAGTDLLVLAVKEGEATGPNALIRIDAAGTRTLDVGADLSGLDLLTADGSLVVNPYWVGSSKTSARVYRLSDGAAVTHALFTNGGPDSGQAVASIDGAHFAAKAVFYWDGVEIREIHPQAGPWQGPGSGGLLAFQGGRQVAVFPVTTTGAASTLTLTITNAASYAQTGQLLIAGVGGLPSPFQLDPAAVVVPGTGAASVTVFYRPTRAGADYATVELLGGGSASFSAVTLAGRTPRNPVLPALVVTQLERYARAQAGYLTNAATINAACGWPRSWYSASHAKEGYVVMHEVALADLGRALSAERGWLPAPSAWALIQKSLDTMEVIQSKTNEFPGGNFFRYYWIRNADGSDRLPTDIVHDPSAGNQPSSDDNALIVHSLLLLRALALEQQRPQVAAQIERIVRRLKLHRFITADGAALAMWRSPSGTYSPPPHWNTVGTEGSSIAAALFALNQLTQAEFGTLIDNMACGPGWYRDQLVPYGDYNAPLFIRLVRVLSGLPVCPEEAPDAKYWMSCVPLVRAHLAWADAAGEATIRSDVMSQTINGVAQTGTAVGNTRGVDASGTTRSGPHAWFIPFARPQWMDEETRNRLLAMMAAYEPLYFSSALGWEAGVPFTAAPPHQGTDAGTAYELLNSMYILLSVYDALRIVEGHAPLSERHPLASAMAPLMEYADARRPMDIPAIRLAGVEQEGATARLHFESLGHGLTNFTIQTTAAMRTPFANLPSVAISNRWGGAYEAVVSPAAAAAFFRVGAP